MKTTVSLKSAMAHPYFSSVCAISMLFILPEYSVIATMVGCATVLSAYVAVFPDSFRGRRGSLTLAGFLVAAMWAAAAIVTVLSLVGVLQD